MPFGPREFRFSSPPLRISTTVQVECQAPLAYPPTPQHTLRERRPAVPGRGDGPEARGAELSAGAGRAAEPSPWRAEPRLRPPPQEGPGGDAVALGKWPCVLLCKFFTRRYVCESRCFAIATTDDEAKESTSTCHPRSETA